MSLVQLYVPSEACRKVIYEIGKLDLVQFMDLNVKVNEFQRCFVKELRRLGNIERQYSFFKKEIEKRKIGLSLYPYTNQLEEIASQSHIEELLEGADLLENVLNQLILSNESLNGKIEGLKNLKSTIHNVDDFFATHTDGLLLDDEISQLESQEPSDFRSLYISGVINKDKIIILEQLLLRLLRGNLYFYHNDLEEKYYDYKKDIYLEQSAFIVFFHGSYIEGRIKKICESLGGELFDVWFAKDMRQGQLRETNMKLNDLVSVAKETEFALMSELTAISKSLPKCWEIIAREKAVYLVMNQCDYDESRRLLVAEGWLPTDSIDLLKNTVQKSSASQSVPTIVNILETTRSPPTFHRTNKFTEAFQNICDAYGISTYREVNPGLPTIVTFPFLFAVMFGDVGHGFIVTLASSFLVINEKKLGSMKRGEIFDMAFTGRYILLLMGLFSMYTGLLYNDVFSLSSTLFSSGWKWPEKFKVGATVTAKQVGVYAFGLDPAWHSAENGLLFTNSFKMKLSILVGHVHMTYSLFLSLVNHLHFRSMIDIVGNFIPGLLFMQGIFGYLSICIVYKWSVDWFGINKLPPGLLNLLISMFLAPGTVPEPLYRGQRFVELLILFVALLCVPWLLFVKPFCLKRKLDKKKAGYAGIPEDEDELIEDDSEEGEEESHSFGDIMIHQIIHTIEFCLNCVSHTASYLRLWALSLAHAQLSSVLWSMTLGNVIGKTGYGAVFAIVFIFAMWFCLTVAVLVLMEGTSAMLHSLRLHWVESMSKFFEGEGNLYEPFAFKGLLDGIL